MKDRRLEDVVERVRRVDRHQPPSDLPSRAANRKPKPHPWSRLGELDDAGRKARRAHGDVARIDRIGARLGQDRDRSKHAVEIRQRLPHPLKHNAVHPLAP